MKKTNTIRQKPSRLWAGKVIQPVADSSSSESEHEVKEEVKPVKLEEFLVKVEVKTEDTAETLRRRERARANAAVEEEEMPSEDEEEEDIVVHHVKTEVFAKVEPVKIERQESSEYESSEEESEDEVILKPVYTPRHHRATIKTAQEVKQQAEDDALRKEQERTDKKKQSHLMAAEEIKRGIVQLKAASAVPNVDDTDGVAPEEEYENWRVREFTRIKRDKELQNARDEEIMDIERRRLMTDAEIAAENQRENPEQEKESMQFMQRYYHKGAFFADDEIMKRDYNQATLGDHVNKKALPEVMQVKKFGLHGRTKWTHLTQEDTSNVDSAWGRATDTTKRAQTNRSSFDQPQKKARND